MLDLRLPVGIFFLLIGVILGIYGTVHPYHVVGVTFSVEQDYGIFLVLFGLIMTFFGWRAEKVILEEEANSAEK